jgi:hypothetical protein
LNYQIYPQAFLKKHGHLQANHLMHPFSNIISDINGAIRFNPEAPLDTNQHYHNCNPLSGIAFQAYNEAMHRIRPRAQYHDVQLGLITANLAGTYARSDKNKRTADTLRTRCQSSLPHQKFAEKIDSPGLKRELRLENVFTLDLFALSPVNRTGSYVLYRSL